MPLFDRGGYSELPEFEQARTDLEEAIEAVKWPPGSTDFAIYPESGKKSGEGNGVVPIKEAFAAAISSRGWALEVKAPRRATPESHGEIKGSRPGAFDAHLTFANPVLRPFAAEWETGNISSSHRAINRIALGIMSYYLSGGVLILPSKNFAQYLTDRIGNAPELEPYYRLWQQWQLATPSYLAIVVVEHDRISLDVPRIRKGTDGRARV